MEERKIIKEEECTSIVTTAGAFVMKPGETDKFINQYFKEGLDGPIAEFPTKMKRKVIVLQHIVKRFDPDRQYTEKEVNEILKAVYFDHVTLRRYLIELGFMNRTPDGSAYWVNIELGKKELKSNG